MSCVVARFSFCRILKVNCFEIRHNSYTQTVQSKSLRLPTAGSSHVIHKA